MSGWPPIPDGLTRAQKRKRWIVWAKKAPIQAIVDYAPLRFGRYVPHWLDKNGTSWAVWDRVLGRPISDAELAKISDADLRSEMMRTAMN